MPTCMHHIPGRLRLRVPGVKGCVAVASALNLSLRKIDGVLHSDCRVQTGSVIVHYDPSRTDMTALLHSLGWCGPMISHPQDASAPFERAAGLLHLRLAGRIGRAVLWIALEHVIEITIASIIAALL